MLISDIIKFSIETVVARKLRSFLTTLGIAIGIAAVVLLTSIGEGVHRFMVDEFTQFGTTLIGINPGRATTAGMSVGVFGTERPLTLGDTLALERMATIEAAIPIVQGNAEIEVGNKSRRSIVYGVGTKMPEIFKIAVATGRFLPDDDPISPRAFAVLGQTLHQELFGDDNALGKAIRIGGYRYIVIGTMASKGQILGIDMDDAIYIPTARAMEIFNQDSLMEIDVLYHERVKLDAVLADIDRVLEARHGSKDYTVTTQQQMLDVLGSVLEVLTLAVAALGGISLLVGSVGIVTIMTISVNERVGEIGLLQVLGCTRRQILTLFLSEAVVLAMLGGLFGLILGIGGGQLLMLLVPEMPVSVSWFYVMMAEVLALVIGLLAGIMPARRAASLEPIESLRTE